MHEDNLMQTEPIYQSTNEDIEKQYPLSDQEVTKDVDPQWLNQFVIHPNDSADVAHVTIPTYEFNMPTLSPSAATDSQLSKQTHNVSSASTNYYFQSGPSLLNSDRHCQLEIHHNLRRHPSKGQQKYSSRLTFLIHTHAQQSWTTPYHFSYAGKRSIVTTCSLWKGHVNLRMHCMWRVPLTDPWGNDCW